MKRKTKNTFVLAVIFVIISATLVYYVEVYQVTALADSKEKLKSLDNESSTSQNLISELKNLENESFQLDSLLNSQPKTIPFRETTYEAYNEIIQITQNFSPETDINIEHERRIDAGLIKIDQFSLKGQANFDDILELINRLEKSRKFYRFNQFNLKHGAYALPSGEIIHQVIFDMLVESYFTNAAEISLPANNFSEPEKLTARNFFQPLIYNEIPPNLNELLEVDGATLLAMIPDGVYIVDKNGTSYTLGEGDEVYLGYLTKIDFENKLCEFLLNRGGIIENITLQLKNFGQKENVK